MSDAAVRQHLTDIPTARLQPVHILQAAVADMRLRAKKDEGKVDPELRYSFMSRHVKRARTETHLIALAFFEPLVTKDGDLRTDKDSTQRIYSQPELLRRTLVALLQGADENSLRHMMEVT